MSSIHGQLSLRGKDDFISGYIIAQKQSPVHCWKGLSEIGFGFNSKLGNQVDGSCGKRDYDNNHESYKNLTLSERQLIAAPLCTLSAGYFIGEHIGYFITQITSLVTFKS